jgi:UrcA family protein
MVTKINQIKLLPINAALWLLASSVACTAIAADQIAELTVEGSRMTQEVVGRSSSTGAPIEEVTLRRHVPYADLDLSTHSGVTELQKRIDATAQETCRELDKMFPLSQNNDSTRSCVSKAVKSARPQAQEAIDSAEKAPTTGD